MATAACVKHVQQQQQQLFANDALERLAVTAILSKAAERTLRCLP